MTSRELTPQEWQLVWGLAELALHTALGGEGFSVREAMDRIDDPRGVARSLMEKAHAACNGAVPPAPKEVP